MALAPDVPYNIGDPAFGGFVAGIIDTTKGNIQANDASQQGQRYVLIVAPKSLESASLQYKTANTAAPIATHTRWDGLTATAAMNSSTYPAAKYCYGLTVPTDNASRWYLPAMDELELIYRNLKPTAENNYVYNRTGHDFPGGTQSMGYNPSSDPQAPAYTAGSPSKTSLAAFQEGGAEALGAPTGTSSYYWTATEYSASNAWLQNFSGSGASNQNYYGKNYSYRVRPVRRILVSDLNAPPYAPTLTFPVNTAIPTTQTNRFTIAFNDPDQGDSMSALRIWARPAGTTTWTIDTGWVATPNPFHDFPAGTFTVGEWEWQAATKDAQGVEGPASPSAFFTAATPPPAPSITDPVNNGTIPTDTYELVWSTPDQDAYQVQVLDGGTVLTDTGVVESATARSRVLDFPDNQVGRTIRVRIRDGGLWSEWATVTVTVSYSPPATPVLSVGPYRPGEVDGLRVQVTHPTPVGDQPTVVSHDVYVREVGDTGPGIRIGADLPATMAWEPGPGQPWLPASGVDYEFRVRAVASSGTTSWSAWTE